MSETLAADSSTPILAASGLPVLVSPGNPLIGHSVLSADVIQSGTLPSQIDALTVDVPAGRWTVIYFVRLNINGQCGFSLSLGASAGVSFSCEALIASGGGVFYQNGTAVGLATNGRAVCQLTVDVTATTDGVIGLSLGKLMDMAGDCSALSGSWATSIQG